MSDPKRIVSDSNEKPTVAGTHDSHPLIGCDSGSGTSSRDLNIRSNDVTAAIRRISIPQAEYDVLRERNQQVLAIAALCREADENHTDFVFVPDIDKILGMRYGR